MRFFQKLLFILTGKKWKFFALLGLFLTSSVLEALGVSLLGPFLAVVSDPSVVFSNTFLSTVYTGLGISNNFTIILTFGIMLIVIFLVKGSLYLATRFYILRFSYHQKTLLQERLIDGYLGLPYVFHLSRNSAELIQTIVNESISFSIGCLLPFLELISNLMVVCILFILLLKTDLLFISLMAAIFLPTIFFSIYLGRFQKIWGKTSTLSQKNVIRSINHALGGIKEVKVVGCESYFKEDMLSHSKRFATAKTLETFFSIFPRVIVEFLLISSVVIYILLSYSLMGKDTQELISVMGVFAAASIRLVPSFSIIAQAIQTLQSRGFALNLIYSDLKSIEKSELKSKNYFSFPSKNLVDSKMATEFYPENISYSVKIENLFYKYPGASKYALKNINLEIVKGESIAFIGESGAGKTTLADILLGLLLPEEGDIKVDGHSIYKDLRSWQDLLGYIPQSIFLLDDTVERNIAFGVPEQHIDAERLNEVIKLAQLEDLIAGLPEGINTSIGERGVMLSGGQRQRIGIARALYHNCQVLVLDEATSALDTTTESLVSDAISSLAGHRTLIIIAHRYSTIEKCDKVYRLQGGVLTDAGSYAEVVLGKKYNGS